MARVTRREKTVAVVLATGVAALSCAAIASAAVDSNGAKCRKTLASGAASLVKTAMVQIRKCQEQRMLGSLDALVDCSDPDGPLFPEAGVSKIDRCADKLAAKAAAKCAAAGQPADLGYQACPAPCDVGVPTIATFGDVGACLACVARDQVTTAAREAYGSDPPVEYERTDLYDCQIGGVGKPFRKYLDTLLKEQRKCQDLEDRNKLEDFDCRDGDLKGRIADRLQDLDESVAGCGDALLAALDVCGATVGGAQACLGAAATSAAGTLFDQTYRSVAAGIEVELSIRQNPNSTISPFADVALPEGATAVVEVYTPDLSFVVEREVVDGTAFLWGLAADGDYVARAVVTLDASSGQSSDVAFSTGSLPANTPALTAHTYDAQAADGGLTLFGVIAGTNLVYYGVDGSGQVVWYYDAGSANHADGDIKVLDDGNLLVLLQSGFRVITPDGATVSDVSVDFHHDVEPMQNGNYLILQHRSETHDVPALGGDVALVVDGIKEIDAAGTVVREWWTSDHLDTTRFPSQLSLRQSTGPVSGYDWSHANALEYVEADDMVLLSLRHQLWLVAIRWSTGEVLWKLGPDGDFTLDDPDPSAWFYAQHAPEIQDDGRILLLDNGNERPNGLDYSRAALVRYDSVAMTASIDWAYTITPQVDHLGDADRLSNGNVLACAGSAIGTNNARLIEVTADSTPEAVWELQFEVGVGVYRATRVHGF